MNINGQKSREEISSEYKWNIEAMYPDESYVDKDIDRATSLADKFTSYQGNITNSASTLLEALNLYTDMFRVIEKVYVYTHMKHDEDNGNTRYTEMYSKAVAAITQISAKTSFFTPELIASDKETIDSYINTCSDLELYRFMLEEIMLRKEHTLSSEQEFVISSLGEALNATDEIFSVLNDVDMNFGTVIDNGIEKPITHASYHTLMESENRELREETFNKLYSKYKELNNTISTIYSFNVKTDVAKSNLRNYKSSLDAALSSDKIPESVYTNLIEAVHEALPAMHKYVGLRKRLLGVEELKMYDIYKPLIKLEDDNYTFEEAINIVCEALSPLGEEYVNSLRNGLENEKWVDIYENKGKTSGAYSFGSYDSYPYILMNYTGKLNDVFTLIHESGHSMHSFYTRKTQPYIYGDHSIFTAESVSTVNETLLIRYLLNKCDDKQIKAYLINFYIDQFKGTLFRQTMFAEFEKIVHEKVESGESLSAEYLNSTYNELNNMYFGPELSEDDMIKYEWSRIPHFYRSYYVYQYATGFSAANAIVDRILNEGDTARNDYIEFLKSGSSNYPIELLKIAGVDMSTTKPVVTALKVFTKLVDELEEAMRSL